MGLILKPRVGLRPRWNNNPMAIPAPVGAWVMNEGGGSYVNDYSGSENNGTFINSPLWVPRGIDFEHDSAQYVDCVDNISALVTNRSFSVVAAIKMETGGWVAICQGGSDDANRFGAWIDSNERLSIISNGYNVVAAGTLSLGIDYDVGFVHQYGIGNDFYIDGNYIGATANLAGPTPSGSTLEIGHGTSDDYAFDGIIYYVYIYNYALTAAQIAYIHQHPYYAWEYPELWEYYAAAAVEGPTMPIFDYYYNQARL